MLEAVPLDDVEVPTEEPEAAADTKVTVASQGAATGRVRVDSATSLWRAAEYGDLGRLKMLLDAGHDINAMCEDPGWRHKTPLSAAVDGNEPLAVRLLLRRGANPNLQDGDGDRYPLHWAAAFGDHEECAQLLVHAGAALEARDAQGRSPLEFARQPSLRGRPKVEAVLARAAADTTRPAWSMEHAASVLKHGFWKAAADGNLAVLERCLDARQPVDQPRPAAKSRMSALAIATYNGRLEAMALLIRAGADANVAEGEGGFTPLHFCVHGDNDYAEAAQMLLEARADPFATKHDGKTALDVAAAARREATLAVLAPAVARRRAMQALSSTLGAGDGTSNWSLLKPTSSRLAAAVAAAEEAGVEWNEPGGRELLEGARQVLATLREEEAAEDTGAAWSWGRAARTARASAEGIADTWSAIHGVYGRVVGGLLQATSSPASPPAAAPPSGRKKPREVPKRAGGAQRHADVTQAEGISGHGVADGTAAEVPATPLTALPASSPPAALPAAPPTAPAEALPEETEAADGRGDAPVPELAGGPSPRGEEVISPRGEEVISPRGEEVISGHEVKSSPRGEEVKRRPMTTRAEGNAAVECTGVADDVAADGIATDEVAADSAVADDVAADGVAGDGAASDSVAADGVTTDDVAADSAVADGVAADGAVADDAAADYPSEAVVAAFDDGEATLQDAHVAAQGTVVHQAYL